jgi:hypothetical protein
MDPRKQGDVELLNLLGNKSRVAWNFRQEYLNMFVNTWPNNVNFCDTKSSGFKKELTYSRGFIKTVSNIE